MTLHLITDPDITVHNVKRTTKHERLIIGDAFHWKKLIYTKKTNKWIGYGLCQESRSTTMYYHCGLYSMAKAKNFNLQHGEGQK